MGPTFIDTLVEPQEPQPSVREGSRWKLYCTDGGEWGRVGWRRAGASG